MNCEGKDNGFDECVEGYLDFSKADRWIVSIFNKKIKNIENNFKDYRFDLLSLEIYQFVWDEYCDWYLEIAKAQLQNGNESQQRATKRTLISILEMILRMSHPVMPFITEEIWQTIAPMAKKEGASIMMQPYPTFQENKVDEASIEWMEILKKMVIQCRSLRGEMGVSPAERIPLAITGDKDILTGYEIYLKGLAKVNEVEYMNELVDKDAPVAIVDNFKLMLNIKIDKKLELARLQKEINRLEAEIHKASGKLENKNFIDKAPEEVITQEKERLLEFTQLNEKLKAQLVKLNS
jgi:valyl-tRNA synthetase